MSIRQRLNIVWAIAQKDIIDAIRHQYILFSLLLPIILSPAMSLIIPMLNAANIINIVVYDPGNSRFVASLQTLPQVELSRVAEPEAVSLAIQQDQIGGLIVPANFDTEMQVEQQPALKAYINNDKPVDEQQSFQQLLEQQVRSLGDQPVRITWVDTSTSPMTIELQPLMFIMVLTITLPITGVFLVPLLIVEEKEKHTLQAILVSPARPIEIVLGKALTGLVYSVLIIAALIALNQGWTGDWLVSIATLLIGAFAMVALGLIVGSVCHTSTQVNAWSGIQVLIFMAPIMALVYDVPPLVTVALSALPTYHLVEVLQLSLAGETATAPLQVVSSIVMLLLITLVAFGIVAWLLRREEH
ncbi:MAG: ABC transporter permease [Chloroflexota bacterium]